MFKMGLTPPGAPFGDKPAARLHSGFPHTQFRYYDPFEASPMARVTTCSPKTFHVFDVFTGLNVALRRGKFNDIPGPWYGHHSFSQFSATLSHAYHIVNGGSYSRFFLTAS